MFKSLKGESEAEGFQHSEIATEFAIAAKNGLGYLVKISGAEALIDLRLNQLEQLAEKMRKRVVDIDSRQS